MRRRATSALLDILYISLQHIVVSISSLFGLSLSLISLFCLSPNTPYVPSVVFLAQTPRAFSHEQEAASAKRHRSAFKLLLSIGQPQHIIKYE